MQQEREGEISSVSITEPFLSDMKVKKGTRNLLPLMSRSDPPGQHQFTDFQQQLFRNIAASLDAIGFTPGKPNKNFGRKAVVEKIFMETMPDALVTHRHIVSVENLHDPFIQEEVKQKMIEAVRSGYSIGIRSVGDKPVPGGTLPYAMGIDSGKKIDQFFDTDFLKWQHSAKKNGYHLLQLIMMENHPNIGTSSDKKEQFVMRVSLSDIDSQKDINKDTTKIVVEMSDQTRLTRVLDENLGEGSRMVRWETHYRNDRTPVTHAITVGNSYLTKETRKRLTQRGVRTIRRGDVDLSVFHAVSEYGALSNLLKTIGVERSNIDFIATQILYVQTILFDTNIALYQRLEVLHSLGLGTVEIQGCRPSKDTMFRRIARGVLRFFHKPEKELHHDIHLFYGINGLEDETKKKFDLRGVAQKYIKNTMVIPDDAPLRTSFAPETMAPMAR